MTNGITKSEEEVFGDERPKTHYNLHYPPASFRISPLTKEMMYALRSELGKSWNQTFLHLISLHNKKLASQRQNNFIFKKRK